jgi:hypothetical protein
MLKVLTTKLVKTQIYWNVTPCRLVNSYWRFGASRTSIFSVMLSYNASMLTSIKFFLLRKFRFDLVRKMNTKILMKMDWNFSPLGCVIL